ncbi:WD40 repeat domain-containing protein [Nonomuraea insulae]|uniref:WD40 repeat domain-containing protein n=1 Tax=Nonomuraea insulae TaxID=1616787 RepID=A0ABW1C9H8_9ACTN
MPADAPPRCPVCLAAAPAAAADCLTCGWTLDGPPLLGRLTPQDERDFAERLAAGQRGHDLAAVARAGRPDATARLESLVRAGPVRPEERRRARQEVASALAALEVTDADTREVARQTGAGRIGAEQTRARRIGGEPTGAERIGAEPTGGGLTGGGLTGGWLTGGERAGGERAGRGEVVVVEIAEERITAVRFDLTDGAMELADLGVVEWRSLVPGLPDDPLERAFALAGGIGERPVRYEEAAFESPLSGLTEEGDQVAIINRLPGWPLPEAVAETLRRRHPRARHLLARPAAGPAAAGPGRESDRVGPARESDWAGPGRESDRPGPAREAGRAGVGQEPGQAGTGQEPGRVGVRVRPEVVRLRGGISAGAACVRTDGRAVVVAGGADGSVSAWALPGATRLSLDTGHAARVTAVDVHADLVVSGDGKGAVLCRRLPPHDGGPEPLVAHLDRVTAVRVGGGAVFSLDGGGVLWRTPIGAAGAAYHVDVTIAAASALAVTGDGTIVATGGTDGMIRLWDGHTGDRIRTVRAAGRITALAFGPGTRTLAAGHVDGTLAVLDLGDDSVTPLWRAARPIRAVAVSPDGVVVAGDDAGTVRCHPGRGGTEFVVGTHAPAAVKAVASHADWLLSAGADGLLRLWPRDFPPSPGRSG